MYFCMAFHKLGFAEMINIFKQGALVGEGIPTNLDFNHPYPLVHVLEMKVFQFILFFV